MACDLSIAAAESAAKDFNIPAVCTDPGEVFKNSEIDIVILATSHDAHPDLIRQAAETGKHVLCEKPLAMNISDALDILRLVKEKNIKLCVDYNRRMSPALKNLASNYRAFKKKPVHHPWRYRENERSLLREEANTNFLVRVQDESASYRLVHLDAKLGGGLLIGESCHWLDLLSWFYENDEPLNILAWGSARLSHGIHVEMRSGDSGTILFNCGGSFDYPKELYEVTYNGALFRSEFFIENRFYGVPESVDTVFSLQHDPAPDIGSEGGITGYLKKLDYLRKNNNFKKDWNSLSVNKGHMETLSGFIDAILDNAPVPCDALNGFRATYLTHLAVESIRSRQTMPVEMRFWHPHIAVC